MFRSFTSAVAFVSFAMLGTAACGVMDPRGEEQLPTYRYSINTTTPDDGLQLLLTSSEAEPIEVGRVQGDGATVEIVVDSFDDRGMVLWHERRTQGEHILESASLAVMRDLEFAVLPLGDDRNHLRVAQYQPGSGSAIVADLQNHATPDNQARVVIASFDADGLQWQTAGMLPNTQRLDGVRLESGYVVVTAVIAGISNDVKLPTPR